MSDNSFKSKRILKNTAFLYIRMLFLLFVTLYTSRVLLDKLGFEDFGIFNLVGGLASMFVFFSSSLVNATQRFLNIELSKGDIDKANVILNQHLILYVVIGESITKIQTELRELNQNYVYLKEGLEDYEVSLIPFVEKKRPYAKKPKSEDK